MAVAAVRKSPPKSSDKEAEADAQPLPPKRKSRLAILVIALLLMAATGGGAFWYLHDNGGDSHESKAAPPKPPKFVPLENFVVNLQHDETPQFLQVGLSLKVSNDAVVDALKLHMPEVRNSILLLLSSRQASELLTLAGKFRLSSDIVSAVNKILAAAGMPRTEAGTVAENESDNAPDPASPPPVAGNTEAGAESQKAAEAGAKTMPEPIEGAPVMSVLFTSFIIQ